MAGAVPEEGPTAGPCCRRQPQKALRVLTAWTKGLVLFLGPVNTSCA